MAEKNEGRRQSKRNADGGVKATTVTTDGVRTRSQTIAAIPVVATAVSGFPSVGPVPHHPLESSRKRAKSAGIGSATGDRRIVEDDFKKFEERQLKRAAKTHFVQKFEQADKKSGSFVSHETANGSHGSTTHEYFGIVEPVKGGLSGRSVETPVSKGFIEGVDNSSHPLPLSAVRNQHEVNKSSLVFSENAIANQGGARVAEELAKDKALEVGDKRVALVTRTVTPSGSDRPTQVTRAVLVRSESGNNVSLLGGYSHDNDVRK